MNTSLTRLTPVADRDRHPGLPPLRVKVSTGPWIRGSMGYTPRMPRLHGRACREPAEGGPGPPKAREDAWTGEDQPRR